MKISHFFCAAGLLYLGACNNRTDEAATSTPIDSTNINGTAPVEYEAKSDTATTLPHEEEGLKANTDTQETTKQP